MSEPYLGQIEAFPYYFVPRGWLACQGQTMPIAQYQALFSLMGSTYGGNGVNTFQLPDLRGRAAMGQGNGENLTPRSIGQTDGEAAHIITVAETPTHTHALNATATAPIASNTNIPDATAALANATQTIGAADPVALNLYAPSSAGGGTTMAPTAIGPNAGGQAHDNMMPYLPMQFCIATQGIYPSRG